MTGWRFRHWAFCSALFPMAAMAQPAMAQDGCALVGMFNPRARELCEAAKRAKLPSSDSTARQRGYSQSADRDGGRDPALEPVVAPAAGMRRHELASGGLYIDLAGTYPAGYMPTWRLNATNPQEIVTDRYNVLNRGPQGTETLFIRIVSDQGRPGLEFSRRSSNPCVADLVGAPQVITGTPKRFRLENFRFANNGDPQCQRKLGSAAPWSGWVTLSATPDGNINMSLTLDLAMDSGQPWFEFTARGLPFANQMTPQMAAADVDRKRQIAQAQRDAAASAQRQRAVEMAALQERRKNMSSVARFADQTIEQDSRSWLAYRYDAGSVVNAKVTSVAKDRTPAALSADYTFNGGQRGSVRISYGSHQQVKCIQFWNESACRPLGQPPSQGMLARWLAGALSGSSGSSGSREGCDAECTNTQFNMGVERNRQEGLNDNGTPK